MILDSRPVLLLVDDEPLNLQVLRQILQGEYRLLFAKDGIKALELAEKEVPALILLDVMMPKKSGFEVCEILRAEPAFSALRIIMLTAKGRDTEQAKGLALGADAYMLKPFSTKDLVVKIREILA